MFETAESAPPDHREVARALPASPALDSSPCGHPLAGSAAQVESWGETLGAAAPIDDPAAAIDRIAALQRLIHRCEGALAAQQAAFAAHQHEAQREAGVPARRRGGGIAEQVGFARGLSPATAARRVASSVRLVEHFPRSLAAMQAGRVSREQCEAVLRGTSHLDEDGCTVVDAALAPRLPGWNTRQTEHAVAQVTYRLDPQAFVARRGHAEAERAVWLRPAPDCMALISALVPVAEGVATVAALRNAAASAQATGDPRTLGQLMADTLTHRCITGGSGAIEDAVSVELSVVMDASTLLGRSEHPARLTGYGPIPADLAREIACGTVPDEGYSAGADHLARVRGQRWIRRLLTDPVTGIATELDTRRRTFDEAARRFIAARDHHCRQPFCDAPVRHIDHIHGHASGGATSIDNGQGLCERGNYAKEIPGWTSRVGPDPGSILVTTPTGHQYLTRPSPPTGLPAGTQRLPRRTVPVRAGRDRDPSAAPTISPAPAPR
ncbi:DUF222 domain-containing protein [Dermacoccaceae bacterium W4C1]